MALSIENNAISALLGLRLWLSLALVEWFGTKIVDILTKSNPWQGEDCSRQNCLLSHTKLKNNKHTSQDCSKHNIVYERTCEQQEL